MARAWRDRIAASDPVLVSALGALALFIVFCTGKQVPHIEADLRMRAEAALAAAEIDWARLEVDGRDLTLSGEAPSASSRRTAYMLTAQLTGVRLVRNRTALRDPRMPIRAAPTAAYSLVLQTDGQQLTLSGAVPDSPDATTLLARARQRFAVADVTDELRRVTLAAPAGWLEAASGALEALVLLEAGAARFDGARISVRGVAADRSLRARTRMELQQRMPAGFVTETAITLATEPATTKVECQAELDALLTSIGIGFDDDSATLQTHSAALLDEIADIAQSCRALRFEIGGHTDDRGGAAENLRLSRQRAEAVMAALVERGVEAQRLGAHGYGEERPLVRSTSAEARTRNRRIDIRAL